MSDRDELSFALTAGALYHRARANWFGTAHRLTMFVNLMASSAAVAAIARDRPGLAIAISVIVAAASSLNLAFDFAGMVRRHDEARVAYHDLAAELEELPQDAPVAALKARMMRAAGREPPAFEAAQHDACNAAIRSLGLDPQEEFVLTDWQLATRHVWPWRGTRFRTRREIAAG